MGELIEVSATVRVESGPPRANAIAVSEMEPERDRKGKVLEDQRHVRHPDGMLLKAQYKLGAKDALGKKIILGKQFHYLDYFAEEVWYVYQLQKVGLNAEGQVLYPKGNPHILRSYEPEDEEVASEQERWLPVAIEPMREAALAVAGGL
jgi:hypothetical protein